ncbi:MAG: hypothetical protein H7645_05260 [Candidatus Heimdallarchaeota archaeon]|nr:hypothetical protein [Candidatus Heimdallarchaeota archaeon]MCK4769730.1 hypothetical protein [Candidatus Heimdallarchaeota archaeon]
MFDIKLSLVTSSGLLLATKPETSDETKQILATGLMTALISFSKEVHQRELQSISYHDRTVSFLKILDFVVIIETIDEEAPITEEQLSKLLQQVKTSVFPLLEGMDVNILTEGEAALIIDKCLQDLYQLQFSLAEQPLKTSAVSSFIMSHSKKGWEILEKQGSGSHIPLIALMLDTHQAHLKFKDTMHGIITVLPEENCSTFTIIDSDGEKSRIGILKIPKEFDQPLFRLYPVLQRMVEIISEKKDKYSMEEILFTLKDLDDPGNRISRINIEDLSTSFLDRTVGKNLEKAIYSAVTADTIFVVGDKPTVKLVIDTLSIFTQHMQTSVNLWVTTEDIRNDSKCDFSSKICGMSHAMYRQLKEKGFIEEEATMIDLEARRVTGVKSSSFFKKLFETVKKLRIDEVVLKIANELEQITSAAMHFTSFALVDKKQGFERMKTYSNESKLSSSVIQKIIDLAIKINPLLEYLA